MIIDCHGHYTTTPKELGDYRDQQKADLKKNPQHQAQKGTLKISDDQLRESVENAQLKLQRERGTDVTIFSPRASWMGHHLGNASTSKAWTEHCNDLIYRLTKLYPKNFVGVAQLPQSPGAPIDSSVRELVRCVEELGFVGCNLNPDTSGGFFNGPGLADRYWYPLYEKMCELEVPAMIHVSEACNTPYFQTTGSYYLAADTVAFMQMMTSDLFKDFPELKLIIPHGGGAVPYHWGRFRGLGRHAEAAAAEGVRAEQRLLRHVRLPSARHRSAARRDSDRQHPVRVGDGRRRARHRSRDGALLRRHEALHRRQQEAHAPPIARRSSKATSAASSSASRRRSDADAWRRVAACRICTMESWPQSASHHGARLPPHGRV